MALKNLQNEISSYGSLVLSEGTLNPEHLLAKCYDQMLWYRLMDDDARVSKLMDLILECYRPTDPTLSMRELLEREERLFDNQYYGRCVLRDNQEYGAPDPYEVLESCYNYFEEIAPEGFYFGTLEGDGACLGWFRIPEETEETEENE